MRWLFALVVFLSIIMVCSDARAVHPARVSHVVPKWGFEKNILARGAGGGERLLGLEYLHALGSSALLKADAGGWFPRNPDEQRRTSAFASLSFGYRVSLTWGPYAEAFFGPGWIQHTDAQLGSHYQFFHDVNLGFLHDGWGIGLGFKHISNAGLKLPNQGRDFLSARFLIPLR